MEVVVRTKNSIKACVECKKQKRKCSGTTPCELCVQRGRTCVFNTQSRRGPKRKIIFMGPEGYDIQQQQQQHQQHVQKQHQNQQQNQHQQQLLQQHHLQQVQQQQQQQQQLLQQHHLQQVQQQVVTTTNTTTTVGHAFPVPPPSPNSTEFALWCENERLHTIDSLLSLRGWMRPLLDYNTLIGATSNSNSLAIHVQTLCMAAAMSRYNGFYDSANQLSYMAAELSNQLFDDNTLEVATAFTLLADVMPKRFKYFSICALNFTKKLSLSTVREARLHSYVYLVNMVCSDLTAIDVRSLLSQHEVQMSERKFPVEVWDIACMLAVRLLSVMMTKFDFFHCEGRFAIRFCNNVRDCVFSKEELDSMTADLRMIEWIIDTNVEKFGREFYFWYKALKILVIWKKGETEQAFAETMQYMANLRNYGKERAFLLDLTVYAIPLIILLDKGMLQPMKEGVDYLSSMFQTTEQDELRSAIIPYFSPKQPPSPSPRFEECPTPSPPVTPTVQTTTYSPQSSTMLPNFPNIPSSVIYSTTHTSDFATTPSPLQYSPNNYTQLSPLQSNYASPNNVHLDLPSPTTHTPPFVPTNHLSLSSEMAFYTLPTSPEFSFGLHT